MNGQPVPTNDEIIRGIPVLKSPDFCRLHPVMVQYTADVNIQTQSLKYRELVFQRYGLNTFIQLTG